MNNALDGRTAVITGGSTGIGLAVARQLRAAGANVVIAGRDAVAGRAAAQGLDASGRSAAFVATDVRREDDVQALMEAAVRAYGGLDFLFNNAGIEGALAPLAAYPADDIDDVLATNIKGVILCLKHAIPRMAGRGGTIVNTASFVGTVVPFPDGAVYGAAKAAVLSLTRTAAAGYADAGVRVYAVCPWITDTPMVDRLTGHQASAKANFGAMNPSGGIATPDDVASVVLSIFAGRSGLASGDAVLVDRGGLVQGITKLAPAAMEVG